MSNLTFVLACHACGLRASVPAICAMPTKLPMAICLSADRDYEMQCSRHREISSLILGPPRISLQCTSGHIALSYLNHQMHPRTHARRLLLHFSSFLKSLLLEDIR